MRPVNPSSSEYVKLCALTPGRITELGRHHIVIVFAKKKGGFLSTMLAGRNKGKARDGASEWQRCDWSASATTRLAFFPQRGVRRRRGDRIRAAGYQQQRELKQGFLINPENVESKSSAHVVKISHGWAATGMIASPEQGHFFLLLNTGVRRTIISLPINPRTI